MDPQATEDPKAEKAHGYQSANLSNWNNLGKISTNL